MWLLSVPPWIFFMLLHDTVITIQILRWADHDQWIKLPFPFLCTWQYKTQSTFVKGAGCADLELLALLLAPLGTDPRLLDLWYNFRTLLPFTTGEFCEESLVNTENLSWGENFTFLYVKSTLIYVLYRDQMTSQSTARHDSPWNICPFRMCLVLGSQKGRVEEWWVD